MDVAEPTWIKHLEVCSTFAKELKDNECIITATKVVDDIHLQLKDKTSPLAKRIQYKAGKGGDDHDFEVAASKKGCICKYQDYVLDNLNSTYPSLKFKLNTSNNININWNSSKTLRS